MLILANGAFKSGSTWQFRILQELTHFDAIPEVYQAEWINPSIDSDLIELFLREVDITNHNYIAKNHLSSLKHRDALLGHPDVRVFDIERDIRDVLVSAYHHVKRIEGENLSFHQFMEKSGFEIAENVLSYHHRWIAPQSSRYFLGSYEGLHKQFADEVRAMAAFLEMSLSDEQIERIRQATSINELRKTYQEADKSEEERFFRKGEIGDWVNYFDNDLLERLQEIENMYRYEPDFRAKIKSLVKSWLKK